MTIPNAETIAAAAKLTALALSVRSQLVARGIPLEDADAIAAACLASARVDGSAPRGSAKDAKLEALSTIGAGAWESWVAESDHAPGRIERLLDLRPFRRQVVRVILEGLERSGAVVWE